MVLSVGERRFRWRGKKWSSQVFYASQLSPEILALDMWGKISFLKKTLTWDSEAPCKLITEEITFHICSNGAALLFC